MCEIPGDGYSREIKLGNPVIPGLIGFCYVSLVTKEDKTEISYL